VAPRSLTNVLRKSLADHHFAWHVQELEFTRARTQWSQWKGSDDIGEVGSTGMVDSSQPPNYAFTPDEQVDLLDRLRCVFHLGEEQIEKVRADLQHGNDAPLQLLLFAACPRIRSVKFTRHIRISGKCTIERAPPNDLHDNPRSGLEYFHQAILIQLRNDSPIWPAGLDSLRDLAIGVDARDGTWNSDFNPSSLLFTSCTRLPHLNSLYCFGLMMRREHLDGYEIEEHSSSVQNIFLDGANSRYEPAGWSISGCKQLRSLTIAGCELMDADELVKAAGRVCPQSLETLMFYDTTEVSSNHGNVFLPESMEDLTRLRTIYVNADDVLRGASKRYDRDAESRREDLLLGFSKHSGDDEIECECEDHGWISEHDYFIRFCMNSAFPSSTEVLVLGTNEGSGLCDGDAILIDEAMARMIEYGRVAERDDAEEDGAAASSEMVFERCFPNLKAIYLDALDDISYIPHHRKRWFSKAIAIGRRFGVDVHTRTTRSRPFHQVDFPKPPTWTTCKPAENDLVFDMYTGLWAPPKCENCGTCKACFQLYNASVWKEVEDELGRVRS